MGNPKIIAIFAMLCLLVAVLAVARYVSAAPPDRPLIELVLGLSALASAGFLTVRAIRVTRERPSDAAKSEPEQGSRHGRVWVATIAGGIVGAAVGVVSGFSFGWDAAGCMAFAAVLALLTGGASFLMFWITGRR
jgi:hypothetical protein